MKKDLSIYIHIPFCYSKCYYCDFNSFTNELNIQEKYVEYLKREIDLYEDTFADYKLKTVFFGGGTPSHIDEKHIVDILEYINKKIDTSEITEVSLEANPKTLSKKKLDSYRKAGINRISVGVQSLDDKLLKAIGRVHTSKDFFDTYEMIKESGFENINVDLMFNLPSQTVEDVLATLEKITELDVPHISFYSLKLEDGTPLSDMYDRGEIELSDEDTEREMYHQSIDFLKNKGYELYEISNFAKKGYECMHNLTYWKLKPYVGLGLSAHSNINSTRYGNLDDFESYFSSIECGNLPIDDETRETIDRDSEISEYIMLGLRLKEGIDKSVFQERYGIQLESVFGDKYDKFKMDGLIFEQDGIVTLTDRGLDLCNLIFVETLPDWQSFGIKNKKFLKVVDNKKKKW